MDEYVHNEIKKLATVGMSIIDISQIVEVDIDVFKRDEELMKNYKTGSLLAKYKINKAIFESAENGSTPAILKAQELLLKQEEDEFS